MQLLLGCCSWIHTVLMLSTRERNDVLFFSYIPRRSIYSIFADQLGWFGGSMVAYIPYMECMGYIYICIVYVS